MILLFRNIDIFLHQVISSFRFGSEISRFPPRTEKTEIIEHGLGPHSIDSFRQSMAEESISDYFFSHSPILSGQKLDRKFFVSLNFSWASLCLLRDSQRPPTKHRGHQCTSCFNVWQYFSTITNVLTVTLPILDRKLSVLQKQTKSHVGMDKGLRGRFSAWEPVCRSGFASKRTPGGFWIDPERFSKQRLHLESDSWFGNFQNNLMIFPWNIRSRN